MTKKELMQFLSNYADDDPVTCTIRHLDKDGNCKQVVNCDISDVLDDDSFGAYITVDFLLPD